MYYAKHNGVGTGELPQGAIAITREQYLDAIERMKGGERVTIIGGDLVFYRGPVQLVDADGYYAGQVDELPEGAPLITDAPVGFIKPRRVNGEWVEGESAADRKARLIPYAKQVRDAKEQGGFSYNGWRFDSDPVSVMRITGAALAAKAALDAGEPFSIDWTGADDEVRTLDAAGVLGMQQALVAHADACHQFCKSVIADIVAGTITTVDEIDSADWPA